MCPKGDDPLTNNLNIKQITMTVSSTQLTGFSGDLGVKLFGVISYMSLASYSDADCEAALETSPRIGRVTCAITVTTSNVLTFLITFHDWPVLSSDNNLFAHTGNPTASDFYCDVSLATTGMECVFVDTVSTDLPGMCSCLFWCCINFVDIELYVFIYL